MLPFAYFLLKVTLCSAVLFGYYWFFLRNKVFHAYNRFYLIAIIILAISLPLCRINIFQEAEEPKTNVIKMLQVVTAGDEFMDEVIITTEKKHVSFAELTPLLYLTVSAAFFIMLLQMLLHIRSLKRNNENKDINNIHFINTDNGKGTPFSFFKYIFWNKNIDIHSPAGNRIFRHELAHIQERHSWDKMFINIILILFWCNPIFWFIRREISMIHEFIADKRAVEDGDTAAFASMVLAASYPQHRFAITNNFFYSPIKRRLMMLTKKQNARMNYFSRLTALPLLVIVFAAFAIKAKSAGSEKNTYLNPVEKIINKITGDNRDDKKEDQYASSLSNKQITVVIDAGHGGEDPGAKNENGITEKDLALQLVKRIKELNTNKNITIILTRETDKFLSPKEKAEHAKAQNPDLFISVHLEAGPRATWNIATGMSVYVAREGFANTEKSKLFASAIISSFQKNYALAVPTLLMQRQMGIWVISANNFPSVLIEAGHITNKKDLAYLRSEKGQETFAINVLNAINDFAGSKDLYAVPEKNNYSDTIGYYKGKAVIGVFVRPSTNVATITFADNTREVITIAQANAAHLLPPPPPPPPPAATLSGYKSVYTALDPAGEYKNKAVISTHIINGEFITLGYADGTFEKLTIKEALEGGLKKIYTQKINSKVPTKSSHDIPATSEEDKIIFTKVEIEPEFPGGKAGLESYLQKNLMPSIPENEGWKPGTYTVQLKFIVENDGSLTDITTENYRGTKTAQHCINIIKAGPKWTPAIQNGHIVTAYKRIPVTFSAKENIDPVFRVGNLTNPRVSVDLFKKQKYVTLTDEYEFVEATVYFSGEGFPKVISATLSGNKLENLMPFINSCVAGSNITFDNIKVKNQLGLRTIDGRAYSLF